MTPTDQPDQPRDPLSFGDYKLQALLGEGTFAKVYQATRAGQFGTRKQVALKVLDRRLKHSADTVSTDFLNEARLGGSILHPNLVETYECGRVGDRLYIAMALIDGPNLGQVIEKLGERPDRETIIAIASQAARGLRAIHRAKVRGRSIQVVHRDMKPANIMLTTAGEVKLTDYGISRFNADFYETMGFGSVRGSPQYMSPEQAAGEELTQASDVFSYGITIGRLISGQHLFPALTVTELMEQIRMLQFSDALEEATERVPELKEILMRCLEARPEHRYAHGGELFAGFLEVPHPKFGDELIGKLAERVMERMPPPTALIPGDNFGEFWSPLSVDADDDDRESVAMDSIVDADMKQRDDGPDAPEELANSVPDFPAIERPADQAVSVSPNPAAEAGHQASPAPPSLLPWVIAVGALAVLGGVLFLIFGLGPATDTGDTPAPPDESSSAPLAGPDADQLAADPAAAARVTATLEIQHEPLEGARRGRPIQITATLTPVGIHQATVWYRADPGGEWQELAVTTDPQGGLSVTLPTGDWLTHRHTGVSYFMDASSVSGMIRSGTNVAPHAFTFQ